MSDELIAQPEMVTETAQKGKKTSKIASMTPEERKEYQREASKKTRKKKAERNAKGDRLYNSPVEIKKKDAVEILQNERLIRNQRAAEICWELAVVAARNLRFPLNAYLFTHGVGKTLEAIQKKGAVAPPEIEDAWYPGERLREHELFAIWDYSVSWRTQPDGAKFSFLQWKDYRRRCITDLVWFGNTVLGKDFQPEPHGRWATELFPNLEPALLSLPEEFGQKDIGTAFRSLSDVRTRCLIACRSSFKSTFSTIFTLATMLCFAGSIRILVCTATQPLAKGFAKSFRNYLTVRDPNNPSLLNQLWPEHCLAPDEGKTLEYMSPFRQLGTLIEPTLAATSVISEGQAGSRYDLAVMDDCAEISNSSTPEMRAKTQERIDMLRELGEPHSLTNYIGTPISQGTGTQDDPGDLYSVLLRREEFNRKEGGDPKLFYVICPGWTVKPGAPKKAWDPTLREDEVDLLFPSRLTFKYLMGKLKEEYATDTSVRIFRQQSLCSWVPDDEEGLRVTFTEGELSARFRLAAFFQAPPTQIVMSLDRAYSKSRYADFSCITTGKVQAVDGKQALVIADVVMDRWKESELAEALVKAFEKYQPSVFVAEKDKNWEDLHDKVKNIARTRNVILPWFHWVTIKNEPHSFAKRAKKLEMPLNDARLWFHLTSWADAVKDQFIKYDGITPSNSTRKDDAVAAISLLWEHFGPRISSEVEEISPEEKRVREQQLEDEARRAREAFYRQRMFSDYYSPPPTIDAPLEPPPPADPMSAYRRAILPTFPEGRRFSFRGRK